MNCVLLFIYFCVNPNWECCWGCVCCRIAGGFDLSSNQRTADEISGLDRVKDGFPDLLERADFCRKVLEKHLYFICESGLRQFQGPVGSMKSCWPLEPTSHLPRRQECREPPSGDLHRITRHSSRRESVLFFPSYIFSPLCLSSRWSQCDIVWVLN